jgi:hypothetical protein
MSARITLHCNTTWREGTCAAQLMTDAQTVEVARAAARAHGWRSHPDGRDYCPPCSGAGPARGPVVLHLHPRRTP